MPGQIYVVDGDEARLRHADGTYTSLHYVDQSIVKRVVTGTVTEDGIADAVYQYDRGSFVLVDYHVDGTFDMVGIEPAIPTPRIGLPMEINVRGTADLSGGEGQEIIFSLDIQYEWSDRLPQHWSSVQSTYFAYDLSDGSTRRLFADSDRFRFETFGDMNADGRDDVLYTDEWGGLYVQLTGGEQYHLTDIATNPDVILAGVGEFAEGFPGLDEMLFYNSDTREFTTWVRGPVARNGGIVNVDYFQELFTLPEGWSFSGVDDYDGDGFDDVLIAQTGDVWIQMVGLKMPLAYWSTKEGKLVDIGSHDLRTIKGGEWFMAEILATLPAEGERLADGATIDLTGVDLSVV